eukprot:TRINITY_DN15206_c0_g1_i1.p2 TRINITY_DN15206_c0_g1~~TRINITY_DN15206_c0_g1_i1.p2  ORF type:complete len:108 (-),score=11.84 TRINITY_DN15206_c0_g1_i1:43-366(-)
MLSIEQQRRTYQDSSSKVPSNKSKGATQTTLKKRSLERQGVLSSYVIHSQESLEKNCPQMRAHRTPGVVAPSSEWRRRRKTHVHGGGIRRRNRCTIRGARGSKLHGH